MNGPLELVSFLHVVLILLQHIDVTFKVGVHCTATAAQVHTCSSMNDAISWIEGNVTKNWHAFVVGELVDRDRTFPVVHTPWGDSIMKLGSWAFIVAHGAR